MNSKIFQAFRIPSLLLAAVLQFMPMVRAALPVTQTAVNLFAIVFRWGAAAAAALGGMQAVSGASTIITTTNFTGTNGVASTNRLLTAPQVAGWWSASGLPPGITLTGSGSSWRLIGTPTTPGVFTFTLMAWSSASAPTSERTTNSNCKFTVVAGGGGGASNSPPVAHEQSVSTPEDTAKAVTLTGSDADGNALTYAIITGPAHGVLSGTAPNVTYAPAANYNGSDSFGFRVNDGKTNSAIATVSITVTPVNDAPVAAAQNVTTDRNVAVPITLAGSDVEGGALTFTVVATPTKGVLSGVAPNLTYTPNNNATGADAFTFKVNDGTVDSATATVSINIAAGPNTVPVADAQSVTTAEDTAKTITLTGSDADGNALTFAILAAPAHGTLTGTGASRTYSPAANYNGNDSFTFRVSDGLTNSPSATISITVTPVNDAPAAVAQTIVTLKNTATNLTLGGTDVDGDALAYVIVTQPAKGTLSRVAPNLTYTPNTNASGADAFTFKVNDGTVDSAAVTVSINIAAGPNSAPIATAQNVTTAEDAALPITLAGTDADGNALTYAIVTPPAHGTLSGTAPNLTYKPATNYNGTDALSFKVNDGVVDSAAVVVSITVTPVNDAPIANAQSVTVAPDTSKAIALTGGDVDGDTLSFAVVSGPAHGSLSGFGSVLSYTPETGYAGADSFWFKANDGALDSASAVVSITVNAAPVGTNDLPIVSVSAGENAGEPKFKGSFLFTRVGDAAKALTVFFTFDGTAIPGVDFYHPGNKLTFGAGRTNATLWVRPIADRVFEGAKTLVLNLTEATNYDVGSGDTASILIGDDDRPHISIVALQPETAEDEEDHDDESEASRAARGLRTRVQAAAYTGFTMVLQSSTDLTNWTITATPSLEQPVDYLDLAPTNAQARFYRTVYVRGDVTEANLAEAFAHQMFSANLVGVVNVALQPGWNLAANSLNGDRHDGPLGDLPDKTLFVPYGGKKVNTYADGEWNRGVPLTRSTAGGWIYNPSAAPFTITYVGEVPNAAGKPLLRSGWNVRSSPVDVAVGAEELLGYPLHAGDALYEFNVLDGGTNSWITHLRGTSDWDVPPTLRSGQGVLIYKVKSTRATIVTAPNPPTPNLMKFVPVTSGD